MNHLAPSFLVPGANSFARPFTSIIYNTPAVWSVVSCLLRENNGYWWIIRAPPVLRVIAGWFLSSWLPSVFAKVVSFAVLSFLWCVSQGMEKWVSPMKLASNCTAIAAVSHSSTVCGMCRCKCASCTVLNSTEL